MLNENAKAEAGRALTPSAEKGPLPKHEQRTD